MKQRFALCTFLLLLAGASLGVPQPAQARPLPTRSLITIAGLSLPHAQDEGLQKDLETLRANAEKLETALKSQYQADAAPQVPKPTMKPGGMKKMKGMPAMDDKKSSKKMGMMAAKDKKMGMGMGMMGGKGMGMMGRMPKMAATEMPSALPGFPGASHIYHIGATSMFLDHREHITLTKSQETQLNKLKEKALLAQASFSRKIEEAEQTLWVLTGRDEPDAGKIEAQIRKIGQLEGDQRIAFIRAVGEAAKALTPEQRKALVGQGMAATEEQAMDADHSESTDSKD